MKNFFNNRRFKHGSLATVITVGFVVLIVIINVIATMLLERYPLAIDLTAEKRFALTQDSISYVEGLKNDVKITVCADENVFKTAGDLYKQAYEIINNYQKYSKKIKVEFVDLQKDPTFAQKYSAETLETADIIIESDLRTKKVSSNELFNAQQTEYGGVIYSSQAEQMMTSAIMFVSDKEQTTVSVLGGMSNADISSYTNLLKQNNFEVIQQDLLTEEINPNASMVILPAPKVDLTGEQVKKLDAYLDNDGNFEKQLVYVSSKDMPVGPILKSFLAEWGMEVDSGIIYETEPKNIVYNSNFAMINKFTDQDLEKELKTKNLPFVVANANPIKVLFEEKDNRKTRVMAATSDTTVVYPVDAGESFDFEKAPKGTLNTMVMGTREKTVSNVLKESKVLVLGSDVMLSAEFLLNAGFNNSDIVMTISNDLTDKESAVKILPVEFADEIITINKGQVLTYTIVLVYVVPALVLIAGIVVWLRRRHL